MLSELRCYIAPGIMAKLDALQQHWGNQKRAGAVETAILEAHARHLPQTCWEHNRAHGYRVLRKAKPDLVFDLDEISDVHFKGEDWVVVTVGGNSSYKFSRKVWEQP